MRRRLLMAVGLLALATTATADPILLTGGTIDSASGTATLTGAGFAFVGSAIAGEGRLDPLVYCLPCFPGAMLSVGGDLTGAALTGEASVQGVTQRTGGVTDAAGFSLQFAGLLRVPPPHGAATTVTVPFTMTGRFVSGVAGDALTGHGLATVWLAIQPIDDGPPAWDATRVQYDFAGDAHAVPEPGSVGLVVTGGLCGVWMRRRRRYVQ